jgi:RNA polymerase sigma factor (sigma-70 family)
MRPAVYAALQQERFPGGKTVEEPSDSEFLRQFATTRSEAAFEALVRRHGPMVEGVCRRILGEVHSAEDAFQAVFMVLVKKSASIRRPELLSNWLYGVACRIARKAKISALRKESRERRAGKMPAQEQLLDLEWTELKAVLDEELSQLPEKYRAPLVLCYLCGQTNAEAAAQLGWPSGSMSERLARAREMLRKRLNRRGLTLSAGLLALLLTQKAASAAVSPLLVEATVKVGMTYSAKAVAAGSVSPTLIDLASDADEFSIARSLKILSLALAVALMIATTWPHLKRYSEKSLWYLRDGLGWNQGQFNGSVGDGASDSTSYGGAAAGAHCSSGSK